MHDDLNVKIEWLKDDVMTVPGFLTPEECQKWIKYFDITAGEYWMQTCFYDSLGMALIPDKEFMQREDVEITESEVGALVQKIQKSIEKGFDRKIKNNSTHAQKWPTGAFARWHSDSHDLEGNPTAWSDNKYASILYLNDTYGGGELVFRDHDLEVKLPAGTLISFPGGPENIHKVNEVLSGDRMTVVGFWDFFESVYTEEEQKAREEEIARERIRQAEQKEQWASGNKDA